MGTNVRRSSGAGTTGLAPLSRSEAKLSEPPAPEAAPNEAKPRAESSPEDWSTPAMQHQMSAIWPLLWLTIPFVLLVLYGLFSGD